MYRKAKFFNPSDEGSDEMIMCMDRPDPCGPGENIAVFIDYDRKSITLDKKPHMPMGQYLKMLRTIRDELNRFISYLEHDR